MAFVRPRQLALSALNTLEDSLQFPNRYLGQAFRQASHLNERDRAFTIHLVQGVLRWRLRLDWIIQQTVRFPFKKIRYPVLNILRLALYQVLFMNRVPESAAVNEAVKQVKIIESNHVARFVNGILRNICREKQQIRFPDKERDSVHFLSVFHSYPVWLVEKWIKEMGIDSAESMLAAGNRIPSLVLRTNTMKIDRKNLMRRLESEGVRVKTASFSPEGITVEGLRCPIDQLNAFREGLFQVQSESAQICSHLLLPKSGERILDVCAGLGGKSTHMAQCMNNRGEILGLDTNRYRLLRLAKSARRLGMNCVYAVAADAGRPPFRMSGRLFDRILIDAPCSALGTISRHPDIKWVRNEQDIRRLSLLQKKILRRAAPLLRNGGRMLYVTCTTSPEENDEVIAEFLEKNRKMALIDLRNHVPEWGLPLIDDHGFFRTFPHIHGMDGFFGALLARDG
jgi:16S rRNA (cytosine967-C5)-methyltransferase